LYFWPTGRKMQTNALLRCPIRCPVFKTVFGHRISDNAFVYSVLHLESCTWLN